MSATLNREGLSEQSIEPQTLHAKPTTDNEAFPSHTKITGTDLPAESKFCLDVCIPPTAPPIPVGGGDLPEISQIAIATLNTEYELVLPVGTKKFVFKDQAGDAETRVSTIQGGSDPGDITFFTIPRDGSMEQAGLNLTDERKLYLQSTKSNRIIELWLWT